jgi:hypothetical protein
MKVDKGVIDLIMIAYRGDVELGLLGGLLLYS